MPQPHDRHQSSRGTGVLATPARVPRTESDSGSVTESIFGILVGMRIIAMAGLWYRASSHRSEMQDTCLGLTAWQLFAVVWSLYVTCFITAILLFRKQFVRVFSDNEAHTSPGPAVGNRLGKVWAVIILETGLISLFYLLTMKPESDVFLLFFVPLLNGTILLNPGSAKVVWLVPACFLAFCVSCMYFNLPFGHVSLLGEHTAEKFLVHIFVIRAFALFVASLPICLLVERTSQLTVKTKQLSRVRDELSEAENLYHSLVDTIPQCILRKDPEGRFTFASRGFVRFVRAKNAEDVLGKTDEDFFPPDLARQYREDDSRLLRGEVQIITKVERNRLRDSHEILSVKVAKVPYHNSSGAIVGTQAIFWDETEAQREKHKLLKWFLHDTPKPLTTIRDKCVQQITRVSKGLAPSQRDTIQAACKRITDIIDFTTASFHAHGYLGDPHKFEWGNNDRFLLSEPVRLVLSILQPNNSEVEFCPRIQKDVEVRSDRDKLIAIIYLVVENSVKALTKKSTGERNVVISSELCEKRLIIEVSDNGVGIPASLLPHIFEEGVSGFGGTGLGLAIVCGLAGLSGGKIVASSVEGEGTTMRIEIGNIGLN